MQQSPWYRSPLVLILSAIVLPPVALVLLWTRKGTGWVTRVLGSLVIVTLMIGHLVIFFGLRVEVDGSGSRPYLTFHKPDAHYAELERDRAEQRARIGELPEIPEAEPASNGEVEGERKDKDNEGDATAEGKAAAESERAPARRGTYWTNYRGPRRDGRYEELQVLTDWPSDGPPLLWKQPVGGGYASFVVANGVAYTIEQRRHQEVVAAYDVETGVEIWTNAWDAEFKEAMGGNGPRSTPTWDGGRVYALGALGELRSLDARTGSVIWRKNILSDNGAQNLDWGMAASPLIVDDKVIVLPGGSQGRSVVAYNKVSGQPVWKVLDDKQAYSSPMLATLAGKRQIVAWSATRLMGLQVEDGALLWEYPWQTAYGVNSAQPIVLSGDRVFLSSGYGVGAAVVEIAATENGFEARKIWENISMKNKFNSSVHHEGFIYGFDDSIFACIDARTGDRRWKAGRYGFGQVLLAAGHLIITTEQGELVLLRATPSRHEEIARVSALEGRTWNNPALADGRLLVRNSTQMACFDLRPVTASLR